MAILGYSPFCITTHPSDMDTLLTPGDLPITTAKLPRPG